MSLIVVFRNISALAPTSDYEWTVLVGDGGPRSKLIASGLINGHVREDGWEALVAKLPGLPPDERLVGALEDIVSADETSTLAGAVAIAKYALNEVTK